MCAQHLGKQKLSDKDQKLVAECRDLISTAKSQQKANYSEYVNGELDKILNKLEQFDIVKV